MSWLTRFASVRLPVTTGLAVAALLIVLSSPGVAGVTLHRTVYYACVNHTTTDFQYSTATATCPTGYVKEHWNQTGPAGVAGPAGLIWMGEFSTGTNYQPTDAVQYQGSAYFTASTTTTTPPNAPWQLLASQGSQGPAGFSGYEVNSASFNTVSQGQIETVSCSPGKVVLGGGASSVTGNSLTTDAPTGNFGWQAAYFGSGQPFLNVWAICALAS